MPKFARTAVQGIGSLGVVAALIVRPAMGDPASQNEYQNIHTIAIISTIGTAISIEDQPFFGDPKNYVLHPNWPIDVNAKEQTRKLLAGRFKIVDIPENAVDPENLQFAVLHKPTDVTKQALRALNLPASVDAILVLHPYVGPIGWGLGITHVSGPIGKPATMAFASYQASVLDAKSFEQIDYGTAKHPDAGIYSGHMLPLEQCPEQMWSDTPEQLTGQRQQMTRDELLALVKKSLPYALASAHLIADSDIPAPDPSDPTTLCHSP